MSYGNLVLSRTVGGDRREAEIIIEHCGETLVVAVEKISGDQVNVSFRGSRSFAIRRADLRPIKGESTT